MRRRGDNVEGGEEGEGGVGRSHDQGRKFIEGKP